MYARIQNHKVVEIVPEITRMVSKVILEKDGDGKEIQRTVEVEKALYHESLEWVEADSNVEIGMTYQNGTFSYSDSSTTWDDVRALRNLLLQQSDWTALTDAPLPESDKQQWFSYRQALRDLPEDYADPALIEWPEQPA